MTDQDPHGCTIDGQPAMPILISEHTQLVTRLAEAEAQLAALRTVARGYCPECGRGDAGPTVEQWERERQRAETAEKGLREAQWRRDDAERRVRVQRERAERAEAEAILLARTIAATSRQTVAQVLADVRAALDEPTPSTPAAQPDERQQLEDWRRKAVRRALRISKLEGTIQAITDLAAEEITARNDWGDGYRAAITDLQEVLREFGHLPATADTASLTPSTPEHAANNGDSALVVEPYRTDRGDPAWVFRCWGTDTCDGWLSLDHTSQQSAERARDRHVNEEHTAASPTATQATDEPKES
jgi:hypothetical protein